MGTIMTNWFWRHYVKLIVGMVVFIILGSMFLGAITDKPEKWPLGPAEEKWTWENHKKCQTAQGNGNYNKETNVYECWEITGYKFRRPKLIFKEKYN